MSVASMLSNNTPGFYLQFSRCPLSLKVTHQSLTSQSSSNTLKPKLDGESRLYDAKAKEEAITEEPAASPPKAEPDTLGVGTSLSVPQHELLRSYSNPLGTIRQQASS